MDIDADIDADFDTKLYKDFVSKLLHIFLVVWEWMGGWGALAPGDVELSLEIFTLPPPPLKSQVKSVMEGWFPQTFWERV